MIQLSQGCIQQIYSGAQLEGPIVQVLQLKKVDSQKEGDTDRFMMLLSDGQHCFQSMLATQNNELVFEGQVTDGTIIKMADYMVSDFEERKFILLLRLEFVAQSEKLGNPINLGEAGHSNVQQQQPVQQQHNFQQQGTPQYSNNGPVASNIGMGRIVPIKALMLNNDMWTIKARVTSKSDVRHWDKGTSKGKLFTAELMDSDGTEIRCTFFKEAVDKFYELLQVDSVYTFSKGMVKLANRQYSTLSNDYEITFGQRAVVAHCADDQTIQRLKLDAVPISSIAQTSPNTMVNIIGVLEHMGEIQSFTSRAGKPLEKLEALIVDSSNASIKVTFWSGKAHELKAHVMDQHPVIAIKKCKVGDYNGRTLSTYGTSQILINPDLPEAGQLRNWYDNGGASGAQQLSASGGQSGASKSIEDRHTFDSVARLNLGRSLDGRADFIEVKAMINRIKQTNYCYPAVPTAESNKKVVQAPNGTWVCEANNTTYDTCEYRYIMSVLLSDATESFWATCFNDTGVNLLGRSGNDMKQLEAENESAFVKVLHDACFKEYVMKLKVKEETVQEESRLKMTLMSFKPLNYIQESADMIRAIKAIDQSA